MSEDAQDRLSSRLWLWGHPAGAHDGRWELPPSSSQITPADAAAYLGIDQMIMVRFAGQPQPPYDPHVEAMRDLRRVVWSVVGDAGTQDAPDEVLTIGDLASRFGNIDGVMMDDFFDRPAEDGAKQLAAHTPDELARMKDLMAARAGRALDLWVVLYGHQLELPVADHLAQCDVITFWSWTAEQLGQTRQRLEQISHMAPTARRVLGCYMYDYGNSREMPVAAMEAQCEEGLELLREGRVDGLIFLASCICDMSLPAVEWTRDWIAAHRDDLLGPS
ncbi:MAG: hypothetical protein HN712_20165 [Gemmatimonadetes bacterium]|nr:hypothetical protein [Gemmatimonadota bacterium]